MNGHNRLIRRNHTYYVNHTLCPNTIYKHNTKKSAKKQTFKQLLLKNKLTLASLELRVLFIYHINTTFTAHNFATFSASFFRF